MKKTASQIADEVLAKVAQEVTGVMDKPPKPPAAPKAVEAPKFTPPTQPKKPEPAKGKTGLENPLKKTFDSGRELSFTPKIAPWGLSVKGTF